MVTFEFKSLCVGFLPSSVHLNLHTQSRPPRLDAHDAHSWNHLSNSRPGYGQNETVLCVCACVYAQACLRACMRGRGRLCKDRNAAMIWGRGHLWHCHLRVEFHTLRLRYCQEDRCSWWTPERGQCGETMSDEKGCGSWQKEGESVQTPPRRPVLGVGGGRTKAEKESRKTRTDSITRIDLGLSEVRLQSFKLIISLYYWQKCPHEAFGWGKPHLLLWMSCSITSRAIPPQHWHESGRTTGCNSKTFQYPYSFESTANYGSILMRFISAVIKGADTNPCMHEMSSCQRNVPQCVLATMVFVLSPPHPHPLHPLTVCYSH